MKSLESALESSLDFALESSEKCKLESSLDSNLDSKDLATFPCTSCGVCCRHITGIVELKDYDRGDGVCKYLDSNLCSIYHNRPAICRVDFMYETRFKAHFTRSRFYKMNADACNLMQENACVDKSFRVKI